LNLENIFKNSKFKIPCEGTITRNPPHPPQRKRGADAALHHMWRTG
jgi:hypothetical protein